MAIVTNLADLDREKSRVIALGLEWHGELGIVVRRYCTLSDKYRTRVAQFHFFAMDSPEILRHLVFRDYLRAHPDIAEAYEKEKRRARGLYPNDSHAFTDEKAAWIRATEAQALSWFSLQKD
jgi:GrpB-like predicted nucleotidyltransferase (UPF0157 family)